MITVTREQVVAKAREYLGTPHKHHGRVKGGAIDCAGLLICVGKELGIVPQDFEDVNYKTKNDGTELDLMLHKFGFEIPVSKAKPGDILVMRVYQHPQHCGFKTDIGMIHSYDSVVEHIIDGPWPERIEKAFTLWAVKD